MNKDTTLGIIRHLLTFGGGFLASNGLADGNEVTAGVSGAVALIGVIWSIVEKSRRKA